MIRPDSGDPELILCGDPAAPAGSPQRKGVVNLLAETFGTTVNAAGFRELDPHVGVIYGDSINFERADAITASLMRQGYVSTTPVFGFGSYTYQFVTRDTFSLAVKATWVQVDGQGRDIFKDPVTDSGTKRSARGRLAVLGGMDGSLALVQQATAGQEANSRLRTVFEDGVFVSAPVTFARVRAELRASWARMRATLPREEHAA